MSVLIMGGPQGTLSAGRHAWPRAQCLDDGSVIVHEDERLGCLQCSWPGAWAQHKCDPSHSPQDLGIQSLCQEGMMQHHTLWPRPALGKPVGCISNGPQLPQQSSCSYWSRGCSSSPGPALQGNLFPFRCLEMLQCQHMWSWYRGISGLSGAPPKVDGDPESWTGPRWYTVVATQVPQALLS